MVSRPAPKPVRVGNELLCPFVPGRQATRFQHLFYTARPFSHEVRRFAPNLCEMACRLCRNLWTKHPGPPEGSKRGNTFRISFGSSLHFLLVSSPVCWIRNLKLHRTDADPPNRSPLPSYRMRPDPRRFDLHGRDYRVVHAARRFH